MRDRKKIKNESKNMDVSLTGIERHVPNGETLISTTDLKGNITYANKVFLDIADFSEPSEALGKPHNIVRHPLMPRSAFQDLWESIQNGRPWNGMVVNRAMNGDHYWVDANVAPTVENGKVTGLMSIRRKPTQAQKTSAEKLYKDILSGKKAFPFSITKKNKVATKFTGLGVFNLFSLIAVGTMSLLGIEPAITFGLAGFLGFSSFLLTSLLKRKILNPIADCTSIANKIGANDLSVRIPHNRNDEIGDLYRALLGMLINSAGTIGRIQEGSSILKGTSLGLARASQNLSAGTEQSSAQAETISAAADEMNTNLQSIAKAVQEMATSIGEVSERAGEAAVVSKQANQSAQSTDKIVKELGKGAEEIGAVIETIVEIADVTRMLALNASIQAAGAGAAGKSFSVVADEVKVLARQTAESSEKIKTMIVKIQERTSESITAIRDIAKIIDRVNGINTAIASAVEEQATTTKAISSSISETTSASREVAKNITGISEGAKAGAKDAAHTSEIAASIENMSASLNTLVDRVLV